jgi:hypothetical protein
MAMGAWKEEVDPKTGRVYFVDPITRASQWVRPSVADFLQAQGIVQVASAAGTVRRAAGSVESDDGGDAEVHMVRSASHASMCVIMLSFFWAHILGGWLGQMLNFWKIYIKKERQDRKRHYNDACIFVVYSALLLTVVFINMPLSTTFLRHQDGLADLLLDEEFADVLNHKKSWYDVMTPGAY